MKLIIRAILSMLLALWPMVPLANAEDLDVALPVSGMFARDQNISVLERQNSEYSYTPLQFGSFTLDPSLATEYEYNSNILAASTGVESDSIIDLRPSLVLKSNWGRNLLMLTANGNRTSYLTHGSQDTTNGGVSGLARWDAYHDLDIAGGFDVEQQTQPRTAINAPSDAAKPITYQFSDGFLNAVKQENLIRLALRGDIQDYVYQNGRTQNGALVYEHDQDYNTAILGARAAYAYQPNAAVFLASSFNQNSYRNALPGEQQRNATGYNGQIGMSLDLSHLLRGDFSVGYLAQHYRSRQYRAVTGPAYTANLTYFATNLINLTLTINRSIADANIAHVGGYMATHYGSRVDYELLRNLKLAASADYETDQFHDYSRTDHRISEGASATWLINRAFSAQVSFDHYNVASNGASRIGNYAVNDVSIAVTVHV